MEHENRYASKAQANLNTVLGAVGSAGATGIINGLGNIFGNNGNCGCNEDHVVNRYELGLQQEIAAKDTKIALLESNIYTDSKITAAYAQLKAELEPRISLIEQELCQQRVYNATNTSAIACINGQIAQLMSLTSFAVDADKICPPGMPRYNSWTAPTTPAAGA